MFPGFDSSDISFTGFDANDILRFLPFVPEFYKLLDNPLIYITIVASTNIHVANLIFYKLKSDSMHGVAKMNYSPEISTAGGGLTQKDQREYMNIFLRHAIGSATKYMINRTEQTIRPTLPDRHIQEEMDKKKPGWGIHSGSQINICS